MPVFNRKRRYLNQRGQKFGKGVWFDDKGNLIKPGQGFLVGDDRVVQYNTDGTKSTFTRSQWQEKKSKEHELKVLQNDRRYGIPYIPSKKMTISIDKNSPTSRNRGATFSENLLDSIAVNAKKARLPFSTALGIAAQESTFGHNKERTVGETLFPWLSTIYNDNSKISDAANNISYQGVQSPTLLISNWKMKHENPFDAYQYDSRGGYRLKPQDESYYEKDFSSALGKSRQYELEKTSPLYHGFKLYKEAPQNYNPGDKNYPSKVEANRQELVNYSPEIKAYMKKHNLHGEGGDLNADYWDSLSLIDKAEMMKVAVANGMTAMPDIRKAYNEFAEGGKARGKDDDYYDYMVKLADKKARDWGVDPDILLTRMLNDNEYNYKAFFNMDRKNAMGMLTASPEAHFSDIGKTVYHPTFSNESVYSGKTSDYNPRGTVGGEWRDYEGKEYYIPSESQFANSDIDLEKTKDYLRQADPNVAISMIGAPDSMLTPEEVRRRNMAKYARLNTYYPFTSDYTWTGHSSLTASRLNPNFTLTSKKIDKGGENRGYSLVTNNCSDATREGLEYVFGKKINPTFFTTPGDVEDFAKEQLGGVERYIGDTMFDPKTKSYIQMTPAQKRRKDKAKGESEVYIPITREEGSKLFDYIEEGKKRNEFAAGGYKPSGRLQKDIALWEGTEMQRNRPFSEMTRQFNATVPREIQSKLQPNQLDALYSYGYNVGMGRLKERVLPTLAAYTQGKASREDVQRAMWATKDSQLRGLTRRRNWERALFGGDYKESFNNKKLGMQDVSSIYTLPESVFSNINEQINAVELPQMQFPNGMDVDPETLYKVPIVGATQPTGNTGDEAYSYNPRQEKIEGLQRMNAVMGMLGQKMPLIGIPEQDRRNGLLEYVREIYGS